MKKKYVLGGVLYNTAKAFGANDTIANSLGMVGGAGEMFLNPLSGGIDAATYGAQLIQNREFGGLTQFEGAKHQQGGITINPSVEVEGGETMNQQFVFSDSVSPKGGKHTYADLSKKIESKYKKRGDDKMAKEAMQKELDILKSQHESDPVIIAERAKQQEEMQMKYGGMVSSYPNMLHTQPYSIREYVNGGPIKPWDGIPATPMMQYDINTPLMGKPYVSEQEYRNLINQYGTGVIDPLRATWYEKFSDVESHEDRTANYDNVRKFKEKYPNVTKLNVNGNFYSSVKEYDKATGDFDNLQNNNSLENNVNPIQPMNNGFQRSLPNPVNNNSNLPIPNNQINVNGNPSLQYNPDEYDSNMQLGPEGVIPSSYGVNPNQFEQSPIVNSNVNFLNGIPYATDPMVEVKSQVRSSQNLPNGYMNNSDGSVSPIPNEMYVNGVAPINPEPVVDNQLTQESPQAEVNTQTQNTPGVSSNNKRMFDIAQGQTRIPIAGALMNSVGPAAQLAGTLINGVDDVNFNRMKADYVDYDPAINIAQREAGNARAANRFNVGNYANSGGQALSNLVAGNVGIHQNSSNQIARIKQDEVNTNNQIKNNVNQANLQIGNEEQIARQQNKAAYRQAIYGALSDMGNIGAGYIRDNSMLNAQQLQDQRTLQMLNALPYRYGWQMGEGK